MKQPPFLNSQIYHIYNRGVDKRKIFMDNQDYFQFINDLLEFNDKNPSNYLKQKVQEVEPPRRERGGNSDSKSKEPLIEILSFVLMPNHYHLILMQKEDAGISKFMQKLGTGYTMYINEKYKRNGSLFQGRFKAKLIKHDNHLLYLPFYIHLNPIKLIEKNLPFTKKWEFIKNYKWSSLKDYIGEKNFPSIINKKFLSETLGNKNKHTKEIKNYLRKDKVMNTFKNQIDEII